MVYRTQDVVQDGGSSSCCYGQIIESGQSCLYNEPPCIIDNRLKGNTIMKQ